MHARIIMPNHINATIGVAAKNFDFPYKVYNFVHYIIDLNRSCKINQHP
jgi:hypothetical protein